jgi:hypothetical protein
MRPNDQPTLLFNPFAPDLLADEAVRFEVVNDTIRISLASARHCDDVEPAGMQLVVIGRLALSTSGARALAINLYNFIESQAKAPQAAGAGARPATPTPH